MLILLFIDELIDSGMDTAGVEGLSAVTQKWAESDTKTYF